ncbi:MAG: hypothetical protein R2867_20430 [Caldilineaceae bacterium]
MTLLDEAARHCGWWHSHRPWQRTYGRFHLGDCHLLTLIYETLDSPQEICVIDLFTSFPRTFDPSQTVLRREGWAGSCLTRFPHDPQLPALPRLLQPGAGQAQVLRYRPHKRCTIRFSGLAEGAPSASFVGESCFAKHFPDERGAELHAESDALWQANRRGELSFAVAQPIRWDEAQQTLWQGVVPGRPVVERLLSNEGPTLANQIGRAAASLPCAALQPSQRGDAHKQLKRSARYAQRLADFFPICVRRSICLWTDWSRSTPAWKSIHCARSTARPIPTNGSMTTAASASSILTALHWVIPTRCRHLHGRDGF